MQLRRVLKTLLAKWVIILLIAVIGTTAGVVLAGNHNDGIKPRWRAEAPVTFFQIEDTEDSSSSSNSRPGGSTGSATIDAETERARAGLLLEESLAANPRLSIQVDREQNTLLFIAIGRDGEETLADALALRDEYSSLEATVLSVDQIQATMATVLADIDRLKEQIGELEVTEPEPEEPAITAQRTALESEIAKLDQRQAQISIWIVNPELRPTEDDFLGVEADAATTRAADETEDEEEEPPPIVSLDALVEEQTSNNVILFRLRGDLDTVPDPPTAEPLDVEGELELEALQLDLDELELQYVSLFRRLDGRLPGGFVEEPIVTDQTQLPRSVPLSGFLGLLVGVLLASLAIIGYDQLRRPVWEASDLDNVISLGFVNRRREGDEDAVWYPTALTQRRRDIQTLRAATDGVTDERPAILGFFGVSVARGEVGELAADLAAAYTVADREVLLIDGNSFHPNTLPEYGDGRNTLNDVLMTALLPEEATLRINEFLDASAPSMPGLTALHVDAELHDPIDVFASPNCRVLMDVVSTRYDMVIVAGPDISDPLANAVIHRVDIIALVGYVGYTETSRVDTAAAALRDRKAEVAGIVLLEGRREPVKDQIATYLRGSRDPETEAVAADAEAPLEIEVDLDAQDAPLPSPAPSPKGSGRTAKAKTKESAEQESAEQEPAEQEPAKPEPAAAEVSVLEKAKAKRANSQSAKK